MEDSEGVDQMASRRFCTLQVYKLSKPIFLLMTIDMKF